MITILIACVFDCMIISGKMDKVSMASFYGQPLCRFSQSVCLASRASKVNLTRTEKAQHERKQKTKKINLRCYALQTLRKVNFSETVKRVWHTRRRRKNSQSWWMLFFFKWTLQWWDLSAKKLCFFLFFFFFFRWEMPTKRFRISVHIMFKSQRSEF